MNDASITDMVDSEAAKRAFANLKGSKLNKMKEWRV